MRGATAHYDAVVGGTTSGVLNASTDSGVPVIFAVLTCDTMEQVGECDSGMEQACNYSQAACGKHKSGAFAFGYPPLDRRLIPTFASSAAIVAAFCSAQPPAHSCLGTLPQALDRAGGKVGNKGGEAAVTAVEMGSLMRQLRELGKAAQPW